MSLNLKKYEVVMIDKWNKFVKANKKDSWILFGFEGKTFDLIHCGSGDDGMEEFVEELSNGRIMYGAISVEDPNTSLQKIVFICWQGQSVPTNIRGKVASFGSAINQFFKGYSIEITATSEEDLSIDVIKEKVKSASGSNYSIHEKKAKGEAKTHEICSYQKVDPISEITNARNTQSQSQAAKFLEEPESDNKLNSAKTVREQRIKEMDEMIKMSRTTNLAKPDEESKLKKPNSTFSRPGTKEKNHREKAQPLTARSKFETSDQLKGKEENLNSAETIKEIRFKEMQEMIKQSKAKDQSARNQLSTTSKVDSSLSQPKSNENNFYTKSVPQETKSEFSTDDQPQEKKENFNSVQKIKELRQKELQDTIQQSKVKAMKDQISSEESSSSSHKKTGRTSEIQASGNVKSAKETFKEKPMGTQFVSSKKDLGLELPSISSKRTLIQNLYQTQFPIESTSGSPTTQISERKKVFFSNYILDATVEMPIPSLHIDEEKNIMVEVLYDYNAENEGDLSIKSGEILTIVEKDGDWWTAINSSGTKGPIPANYVEIIDLPKIKISEETYQNTSELEDTFSIPESEYEDLERDNSKCPVAVVGCYDYEADEEGELSFTEGEKLTIIDKSSPYWWKATNSKGITGDIPWNYVEELLTDKLSEIFPENPPEDQKYKAEHSYEKEDENELSIQIDEILSIVVSDDSGWSLVKNDKGEEGYVPSNFLVEI